MKVESIQAAKAAYDIEAQCILEMKDYFDEVAFARAVHLLAQARASARRAASPGRGFRRLRGGCSPPRGERRIAAHVDIKLPPPPV